MAARVLFLSFCFLLLLSLAMSATSAHEDGENDNREKATAAAEEKTTKVYIVYLREGIQAQPLLTSVLGSEEAAKSSLLYTYSTVGNGFSAKLTPSQAAILAGKPGVLQVVPSQTLHLHGRT